MLALMLRTATGTGATGAALSLRWSDPDGLAATTAQEFESRLSERLGHTAFDAAVTDRTLTVTWKGSAEQCRVELLLVERGDVEGTRQIRSPKGDCRGLVPALLTVAALLLEDQPLETVPAATAAPPSSPPAPSPPPPAPPKAPAGASQRVFVGVGAALTSGFAPKIEWGPSAELLWVPLRLLRLGAEGAWFLKQEHGAGPGFSLSHRRAGLLACGMPLHDRLGLGFCVSGALQFFSAEGYALTYPQSRGATTVSIGGELRAEWRLASHWWVIGRAGVEVATRRLYFYYTPPPGGEVTLFRQQRLAPVLLLGLGLDLP